MILDRLENIAQYRGLSANFAKAVAYLTTHDVFALPLGEFDIAGREVYAVAKETALSQENLRWEAHEQYADIQIILEGAERFGFVPHTGQPVSVPYDAQTDCKFYQEDGKGLECTLRAGDFIVFLPGEPHRPDCPTALSAASRKLVVKVAM